MRRLINTDNQGPWKKAHKVFQNHTQGTQKVNSEDAGDNTPLFLDDPEEAVSLIVLLELVANSIIGLQCGRATSSENRTPKPPSVSSLNAIANSNSGHPDVSETSESDTDTEPRQS